MNVRTAFGASILSLLMGAVLAASPLLSSPGQAQGLIFNDSPDTSQNPPKARASEKSVEIAQRLLKKLGLFNEAATGELTPATQTALTTFARLNNAPGDGRLTDDLIARLRRAAWVVAAAQYRDMQDKFLTAAEIREAQAILLDLGYSPGGLDGTFGPGTMSAIESFQDDQQITVDGLPTRTVLMNLKRLQKWKGKKYRSTLRLLNWTDYIDPAVLESFEAETGTQIIYDVFTSNEELKDKLRTAEVPYDVAFPSSGQIQGLADEKLLQRLSKSELANLANIDSQILGFINTLDPGNNYQIPYLWGTIGLGANKAALARVGASGTVDSLRYVFDPAYARKLAPCGVRVLDSASDAIPLVLMYLGLDPASHDPADIRKADAVLQAVKQWVKPISTAEYIDALSAGKICVMLAFSGDVIQARGAAAKPADIDYQIAMEGGTLWFDTVALPAGARNIKAAHAFMDFVLRPKVSAAITNYVSYANANEKSGPFIDPVILQDSGVYPSRATRSNLRVLRHVVPEAQQEFDRIWARFKE